MSDSTGETLILLEQKEELEALENIYLKEMDIVKSTPPYKISIELRPFLDQNLVDEFEKLTIKLQIELSKGYPHEFPKFQFTPLFPDITQNNIMDMEILVQKIMEKNKDAPMIFEIVENIRLWIQNNIVKKEVHSDAEHSGSEEEVELKHRTVFTPVTAETFLAWKKKFDAEMAELKKKDLQAVAEMNARLSGRQFFEKNRHMKVEEELEEEEEEDVEEEGSADADEN